jgi:hypothetical protein
VGLRLGDVEMAVFVDVREDGESAQIGIDLAAIVRLHRLDECVRLKGYPRKRALETIECRRFLRRFHPERKGALSFPVERQCSTASIEFYQLECQMIESRSDLINALTSKNGDGIGRGLDELQFIAAVRMFDDYIRLTLGVVLVNIPYRENVLLCPDQFKVGRLNTSH